MIQTDLYSFSYKKGSLVPFCKRCGEQNFYRDGRNKKGIQRYECKKCNLRFVWTSDLQNKRFFSNIISFAVEIYTDLRKAISQICVNFNSKADDVEIYTDLRKAISLEGVAELLKKIAFLK